MGDYRDYGLIMNQAQAVSQSFSDDVTTLSDMCIQTEWTGTVLGTLVMQGRNHPDLVWQTISSVTFAQPAGSAGGELFFIKDLMCKYMNLVFTFTSGAGSFKMAVNAKDGD